MWRLWGFSCSSLRAAAVSRLTSSRQMTRGALRRGVGGVAERAEAAAREIEALPASFAKIERAREAIAEMDASAPELVAWIEEGKNMEIPKTTSKDQSNSPKISRESKSYEAYVRGLLCFKQESFESARDCAKAALARDPLFGPAWMLYAECEQALKSYQNAIALYSKFVEDFVPAFEKIWAQDREGSGLPSSEAMMGDVLRKRGSCYLKIGDLESAEADLTSAIHVSEETQQVAYVLRAQLRLRRKDHQLAASDATRALELSGGRALNAYHIRSLANRALGLKADAIRDEQEYEVRKRELIWQGAI